MAGTIFGLPLSQQHDGNGKPMAGCLLYIYEAGTTTPATAYSDIGLTTGLELTFPIEADADGRIPSFWLDDGSYRVRLTDSAGTVKFDEPIITAIGPSSGEGGGGGGVSATAIFATGDTLWIPKSGTRSGWVRDNGRTIGSATSSATERANSDCEALFTYYWDNYSDTLCPVVGGRGANAAADWAANKRITTLDMRGRAPFGLDDMGNSAASRFTGVPFTLGNATTAGSTGGEATHTLLEAELPSVTADLTGTDPGNVAVRTASVTPIKFSNSQTTVTADGSVVIYRNTGDDVYVDLPTPEGTTSFGSDDAHNNVPLFALGTWYRKL